MEKYPIDVTCVGHPLVDEIRQTEHQPTNVHERLRCFQEVGIQRFDGIYRHFWQQQRNFEISQ